MHNCSTNGTCGATARKCTGMMNWVGVEDRTRMKGPIRVLCWSGEARCPWSTFLSRTKMSTGSQIWRQTWRPTFEKIRYNVHSNYFALMRAPGGRATCVHTGSETTLRVGAPSWDQSRRRSIFVLLFVVFAHIFLGAFTVRINSTTTSTRIRLVTGTETIVLAINYSFKSTTFYFRHAVIFQEAPSGW